MVAVLFGSIGTIAETSELQRAAFNEAFLRHGLDWHWSREQYVNLLAQSGGRRRIEGFARANDRAVDSAAIHQSKSEIFRELLHETPLELRPGVAETIEAIARQGIELAFVTTTSARNVAAIFAALSDRLRPDHFEIVIDSSDVAAPKPAGDAYALALARLGESPETGIAIEDNVEGLAAARAVGLSCVAFPGQNTARHDFKGAMLQTDRLQFRELHPYLASP